MNGGNDSHADNVNGNATLGKSSVTVLTADEIKRVRGGAAVNVDSDSRARYADGGGSSLEFKSNPWPERADGKGATLEVVPKSPL